MDTSDFKRHTSRMSFLTVSQKFWRITKYFLSDVIITSSKPDQSDMQTVDDWSFKSALESNVLQFSFQDGRVEDLCPSGKEETMSLNFKRGVRSAFQNSMNQHERDESLKEVDVTGVCPTEYKVAQKGWESSQFAKTKDLLGCSDCHDYRTSLQSTSFRLPDTIQSLTLLKGSHKCVQMVAREGYVQSSTCTESLVFRPFSRQEAGARTESTQRLTFTTATASPLKRKELVTSRSTLLFEHKQALGSNDRTLWSASEKLTELCRITLQDIPSDVPDLFAELVYLMQGLESKELLDIADRVQRKNICEDKKKAEKFFQDALPMVGTSSSIEVMTKMLLSQEVTGTQADIWITSLHFVQHPTVDMLSHLKKLLLSEPHRMASLLPVTTLVNNFCRSQSSCLAIPEVGDILNDIQGSNCQSVEQNLILMTLRAVGNLGYSDALAPTLEKCVKSNANSINTRVTAVQAYRGLSCRADIKKSLEKEQVNQVGSFVWTHLTNLMETSSLHKHALKDIDENLQKAFNSRNYEVSFFSEKFGTGAVAESNLIWSSKSFLPRHSFSTTKDSRQCQKLYIFLKYIEVRIIVEVDILVYMCPKYPAGLVCPRYPTGPIDKWYDFPLKVKQDDQVVRKTSVRALNISSPSGLGKTLVNELLTTLSEDKNFRLLFHGTTHMSAMAIMRDGIRLDEGKLGLDFSSGDAFYLTENFETARLWKKDSKEESAVIVYKVSLNLLDVRSQRGLDLRENKSKWEQVVTCCRCFNRDERTAEWLRNFNFIIGPMCLSRTKGHLQGFDKNDNIQLCVRSDDYAKKIGMVENIACVLFY